MVVSVVSGSVKSSLKRKEAGIDKAESERVELDGKRELFRLRSLWSTWIIAWISFLIFMNIVITINVGDGNLDFTKYQWFITSVTAETFLQIVGLGYIAVRFLFKSD